MHSFAVICVGERLQPNDSLITSPIKHNTDFDQYYSQVAYGAYIIVYYHFCHLKNFRSEKNLVVIQMLEQERCLVHKCVNL